MKKKFIAAAVVMACGLMLSGCGDGSKDTDTTEKETVTEKVTEKATEKETETEQQTKRKERCSGKRS